MKSTFQELHMGNLFEIKFSEGIYFFICTSYQTPAPHVADKYSYFAQ